MKILYLFLITLPTPHRQKLQGTDLEKKEAQSHALEKRQTRTAPRRALPPNKYTGASALQEGTRPPLGRKIHSPK
jgi:hypothetical protein